MTVSSTKEPAVLLVLSALLFVTASAIYAPGERCRGAPGYAAVPWQDPPCGGGAACDVPDEDYGFRCPDAGYGGPERCYKTGERAQGAHGKPAVPWRPCCEAGDVQVEKDEAGAWGKFCLPKDGCYETGERAQGAVGKPFVSWKRCCNKNAVQKEVVGDWGKFCVLDTPVEPTETNSTSVLAPGMEVTLLGETTNTFVAACNDSAVLLSRSVPISHVLINVEGLSNATILRGGCSLNACGVLFRVAVSQERANFLGDVGCPDGAQCFLVQTSKASITGMFGSKILIGENGEMGEDKTLEEILGCDSEIGDTLSVRQRLKTIETSSRQELPDLPDSFFELCNDQGERMWRKSLFGCPFSIECNDNPDKACYHCTQAAGSTCNNGCGGEGGPTFTSLPGTFDFANSCCGHDFCYDSQAFPQEVCDNAMFRANVKLCRKQTLENPLVLILQGPTAFARCIVYATAFRAVLKVGGKGFYEQAGLKQQAHIDTCEASPEPTDTPDADEVSAGLFTDPHLRTFDQLAFDCQASGEFILARSASSGFMLQGRFSGQDSSGSVLTGVVLQDGDSPRLEVAVLGNTSTATTADCAMRLVVDGVAQPFESASLGSNGSSSINVDSRVVTLATVTGSSVAFATRRSRKFGCYLESFSVSIPASMASQVSGLLGTPNGDKDDDWQDQNGTVVPLPENRSDRLFRVAYMYCTENWCIRDAADSMFSYLDGQSHGDFAFCDRPYTEPDLSSASPELVALCGESFECLVDGIVGDFDDATAGRDALAELNSRFNTTVDPIVTLPSNLSDLILQAKFSWEAKGDLDTSASWLGETVGFGCDAGETLFLKWSQDDTSATGFEQYDIDLEGYLLANSWNGSIEVKFGAGWYSEENSLGPATLRMSLRNQTSGEDVAGTVLDTDVNPGFQDGCANENVVAVAKLSEGEGGSGVRLEVEGLK